MSKGFTGLNPRSQAFKQPHPQCVNLHLKGLNQVYMVGSCYHCCSFIIGNKPKR